MEEIVSEVVTQVLESEANINGIIDLLELLKRYNSDPQLIIQVINGLKVIFCHYIKAHLEWFTESSKQNNFLTWIRSKYNLTVNELLSLLHHEHCDIKVTALNALMQLLESFKNHFFPNDVFVRVISQLMCDGSLSELLYNDYVVKYNDIKYYTLQNMTSIIRTKLNDTHPISVQFVSNTYCLLNKINMKEKSEIVLIKFDHYTHEKCCDMFSNAWLTFLQLPLSRDIHKNVLSSLHTNVIPHMSKPHLLVDYLVESYDQGGLISLLSLNGLFILMHHYHIDYPQFYNKLYCILTPNVFHVKYMQRFFKLLNIFLSSSHLPLYIVAAFAKKLSRLSLMGAPPEGIMVSCVLIMNLIRRHPNCKVLLHRQLTDMFEIDNDPFNMEENDPVKCGALQSCLWEIKTLQCHYCPQVSSLITVLLEPDKQTKQEPFYNYLQLTSKRIFLKEFSCQENDVQINFKTSNEFWDV